MMDQYCSGDQRNIELIFSVFLELLEGSVAIQRHAFDLLFNLAVHANLYSDMTSSGESKADDEDSDKIRLTAEKIHEDLFQKLREMIYVVFHKRKTESGLWKTALNCLFFFLSSNGHIDKARLLEVDIRWIPVFLSRTKGLSDFACRQLVKMLVNLLYVDDVLSNERVQGPNTFSILFFLTLTPPDFLTFFFPPWFQLWVELTTSSSCLSPLARRRPGAIFLWCSLIM